jgi:hypothetical protein
MTEHIPLAQFRSEKFAPLLPDESQVNPGVFGAELAYWLSSELARRGVFTSYPEYEDYGWFIEYSIDTDAEFTVWCANLDGSSDRWELTLKPQARKLLGRNRPSVSEASALLGQLRALLEAEPSISDLVWHLGEHAA